MPRQRFMLNALALLALSLLLTGCADGEDSSDYESTFRAQHPYEEVDVTRDGHAISTRLFQADTPDGPPVIMLHGFPDSQNLYDRVAPLVRTSRDVATFDFVGWGRSDKPDAATHHYDSAGLLADLEAVIAALGWDEVVLVVHDAGAWPGIDWALDHPERVAGLVILNSVYGPSPATPPSALAQFITATPERDALADRVLTDTNLWLNGDDDEGILGYRWQVDAFMSDKAVSATYLPVFEALSLDMRPAFLELASGLISEVVARAPRGEEMATFEPPVRVVFGADDPNLGLDVAASFSEAFPNATQVDIVGANHYVQMDAPDVVAAEILATGTQQ